MAKALTKKEIDALCENLKRKDIEYASELDARQEAFLKTKPRIKNWQEFKLVEDVKRVMVGLHTEKAEPAGAVVVRIHNTVKVKNESGD